MILPRNFKISYFLLNKTVKVYNGKEFHKILISKYMVGYKIGEFSNTRSKIFHKKKL